MSDTIVMILEETLGQLIAVYKQYRFDANIATRKAYHAGLRVRAMAELIEHESAGSEFQLQYSQAKILKDCGLESLVQVGGEGKE